MLITCKRNSAQVFHETKMNKHHKFPRSTVTIQNIITNNSYVLSVLAIYHLYHTEYMHVFAFIISDIRLKEVQPRLEVIYYLCMATDSDFE